MPPQPPPAGALLNKSVLWNDEWRSSVGSKPRPLWVLPPGSHDGPADTYKVKWCERGGEYSHNYVDAEDVRDDDEAVARAARAQDVDAVGPPAAAEPLNQGLRLLEAAGSHTVVVKKERDEAKEDAEEQEELAGKLVQSENAKMTKIDELKTAAASKDASASAVLVAGAAIGALPAATASAALAATLPRLVAWATAPHHTTRLVAQLVLTRLHEQQCDAEDASDGGILAALAA